MAISLYQCKICKCILSDSNSLKQQKVFDDRFVFSCNSYLHFDIIILDIRNATFSSTIEMDQTELGGDCCWRTVICEQALIVSYFNE